MAGSERLATVDLGPPPGWGQGAAGETVMASEVGGPLAPAWAWGVASGSRKDAQKGGAGRQRGRDSQKAGEQSSWPSCPSREHREHPHRTADDGLRVTVRWPLREAMKEKRPGQPGHSPALGAGPGVRREGGTGAGGCPCEGRHWSLPPALDAAGGCGWGVLLRVRRHGSRGRGPGHHIRSVVNSQRTGREAALDTGPGGEEDGGRNPRPKTGW